MESQKRSSQREHLFRVLGSFWRNNLFLIKLLIYQNYRQFLDLLHILRRCSSTSMLTLHLSGKTIFPPIALQSDLVSEYLVSLIHTEIFLYTLPLQPYRLQMLKQLKDLTGLLLVPIFTSFQKRQLCSPNNIHFLFSRLVNFLLINLEISRLSISKACFLEKEKKVLMLLPNHR